MSMRFPVVEEVEAKCDQSAAEVLLDVQDVSKMYHLWESPRARLIYGLWSQVPAWAPRRLAATAEAQKAKLGHDFYALREVSLQLRRGESVAIMGRNGSGKSTLLQIICGTLRPSGGVVIRNCDRIAALLELGSGFNPEFTGRENVYLNGAVLGLGKDEIDAKFARILEFAEINQFIDQPVKTYSSGMMVRLAFAVQVLLDPEILIVDEALAVGDIFFQQKCFAYMRELKERGCSFLLVSHDVSAVQGFCDRGVVLVEGRKYFEGPSQDAIREYRLTEKTGRKNIPVLASSQSLERALDDSDNWKAPAKWLDYESKEEGTKADVPVKLRRWSCVDESGEFVDHFSPGQKIRFFVEFESPVAVHEASAGFAVRDRTGQIIHGKHQYQIEPERRVRLEPSSLLQCEFGFRCYLASGEYTVEFGLVELGSRPGPAADSEPQTRTEEFSRILCYPPAVGKFSVAAIGSDPIRRNSHFGMVDVDAQSRFRTIRS
jgi:lipopolysaccharide transport system ATP-binding protein